MPNRSALARPHFPLVRWLPLLIAVIAAVPPPELEAATLSTDASFEWPTAADADAANAAWVNLNNWTMTLTPGTPLPLVVLQQLPAHVLHDAPVAWLPGAPCDVRELGDVMRRAASLTAGSGTVIMATTSLASSGGFPLSLPCPSPDSPSSD